MRNSKMLRRFVPIAAALALVAAGCGDDNGDSQILPDGADGNGAQNGDNDTPPDDDEKPDENSSDEVEVDAETDDPNNDESAGAIDPFEASDSDASGTVWVDEVEYEVPYLISCQEYADAELDLVLDLGGEAFNDEGPATIYITIEDDDGTLVQDVSWTGPEGVYSDPDDLSMDYSVDEAEVTGTATLNVISGEAETVEIEFDLEVPPLQTDCDY